MPFAPFFAERQAHRHANVRWLDWVQIGLHSWDYRWQHCSFDRSACAVNAQYPHWRNLPVFP